MRSTNKSEAAFTWRPAGSLLTAMSAKTVKGEAQGYVTGILYLQPHTMATAKTVCPFSTEACRTDCLYHAGMGSMPRQQQARLSRTLAFWDEGDAFLAKLALEIIDLRAVAARHGMSLAIRLNGTSDIDWEAQELDHGQTLMETFPGVTFYDYTKWSVSKRMSVEGGWPANYHLTFSMNEANAKESAAYLRAGQSVAVVVPEERKLAHESWFMLGDREVTVIDGDLHDLRFLDPPGSLVMLSPKGNRRTWSGLVRQDPRAELLAALRS